MLRDDNQQDLKAAFAELHRRECADAPPFEAMRQRAMSAVGSRPVRGYSAVARVLLWGAPSACAALLMLWMGGRLATTAPTGISSARTARHVEQLLDSIEQHIEATEAISAPVYATDALLSQIDTDR